MMNQGFKRGSRWRTNSPEYLFFYLIQNFQVATCSTSPDMKTVFHTWPYGRFLDIHSNLERKKFLRTNQGSNFSEGSFTNRDNVRAPIKFRRESQPQHLKRWYFLKNKPIHFHINSTCVKQNWSGKTKLAEFFQHWNQQATSCPSPKCRSDSSSESNSSCCHISDAWSYLE